ncbi:hypothetical protein HMI56_007479 [Coelomomyces lativittatus]|nr:hypothetical protein HMI56_007479 [Coelomomyces lativittatus]
MAPVGGSGWIQVDFQWEVACPSDVHVPNFKTLIPIPRLGIQPLPSSSSSSSSSFFFFFSTDVTHHGSSSSSISSSPFSSSS